MNEVHEKWMLLALEEAKKAAALDEVPIGALLVHESAIIGRGMNLREKTGRTTAHAEIEALHEYNLKSQSWRLPEGTSLYVTIEPCLMCTGAFLSSRVSAIYYGSRDTKNAGLSRVEPWIRENVFDHIPAVIAGGILEKECGEILSNYFKLKRKSVT